MLRALTCQFPLMHCPSPPPLHAVAPDTTMPAVGGRIRRNPSSHCARLWGSCHRQRVRRGSRSPGRAGAHPGWRPRRRRWRPWRAGRAGVAAGMAEQGGGGRDPGNNVPGAPPAPGCPPRRENSTQPAALGASSDASTSRYPARPLSEYGSAAVKGAE